MSSQHRAIRPKAGRRYLVIRGEHKGRLIVFQREDAIRGTAVAIGWLCDGWGGRTGSEVVIRLSDVE